MQMIRNGCESYFVLPYYLIAYFKEVHFFSLCICMILLAFFVRKSCSREKWRYIKSKMFRPGLGTILFTIFISLAYFTSVSLNPICENISDLFMNDEGVMRAFILLMIHSVLFTTAAFAFYCCALVNIIVTYAEGNHPPKAPDKSAHDKEGRA